MASIAIIAASRYHKENNKLLIQEAEKVFDKVLFVPVNRIAIVEDKNESKIMFKSTNLLEFDACYARFGASDFLIGEAVLRILDKASCYCPVSLKGYQISNHKYYTIKKLGEAKIPCLATALTVSPEIASTLAEKLSYPVVVKLIKGFAGKGVMLIREQAELKAILDTVHLFEDNIALQEYARCDNTDIRCYVFGDEVISVKRIGAEGDWRANISRGGKAELTEGSPKMEKYAVKAAKLLGFDICAVDFVETELTKQGFAVVEVNFQPGPFRKYLGNLIPKKMMEFIYEKAKR